MSVSSTLMVDALVSPTESTDPAGQLNYSAFAPPTAVGGQRIRKTVEKTGSIVEQRIYFGSFEIYRKTVGSSLTVERQTLHVNDDAGRIAMLELRTFGADSDDDYTTDYLERYSYSNHLGSATLELDGIGDIISYEEYHPYGTTAYQAMNASINAVAKRYRFTGKERDEESGLNYHGARYYALWLCRWAAVDPLEAEYSGSSSYNYCLCNPILNFDPHGTSVFGFDNLQNTKHKFTVEILKANEVIMNFLNMFVSLNQGDKLEETQEGDLSFINVQFESLIEIPGLEDTSNPQVLLGIKSEFTNNEWIPISKYTGPALTNKDINIMQVLVNVPETAISNPANDTLNYIHEITLHFSKLSEKLNQFFSQEISFDMLKSMIDMATKGEEEHIVVSEQAMNYMKVL